MIYGLETAPLPEGYIALEADCILKCLDENGEVTLLTRGTNGLMIWESVGMFTVALDIARQRAVSGFRPDDREDHDES